MITYIDEKFHLDMPLKGFDFTEPQPTPPEAHELDAAAAVVVRHIAEECHRANEAVRHRNPHMVAALVTVDLDAKGLDTRGLFELVEDFPPKGEFPTWEARDNYEADIRGWLDDNTGNWGTR